MESPLQLVELTALTEEDWADLAAGEEQPFGVTRSLRGRGLMSRIVEPLLELAGEMGPDRAMIFCRPELVAMYQGLAFSQITAEVWVDQPGGRVRMPMRAMWRALRGTGVWPPGRVQLHGLPF